MFKIAWNKTSCNLSEEENNTEILANKRKDKQPFPQIYKETHTDTSIASVQYDASDLSPVELLMIVSLVVALYHELSTFYSLHLHVLSIRVNPGM